MPRIPRSRPFPPVLARVVREDDGFGLIEVLVSAVLLIVLATATFQLIDGSHKASAAVRSRSVAADIAHDDLNRLRQMKFSIVSGTSYQSKSSYPGVDGVTYTVNSTVTWATDTGVETSCTTPSTAGSSQYLRIRSSVTWPAMGSAAPIVADSIMAPRGREANRTTGALMVKVQDRDAAAVNGATVSVAGQTLVTNANGCVFFPSINAGQWPVTIGKVASPWNYMDSDGNSPGAATASIVVNDVSTLSVSFDVPSKFAPVTFTDESGAATAPKWPSMTLTNASKTIVVSGANATTQASNPVFPFASGWSIYAGKCAGNNPSTYATNPWPALTDSTFVPARGATISNGKAYMRVLTLNFGDSLNTTGTNSTLDYVIKPWSDSTYTYMAGCTEGVTGSVTVTGSTSQPVTVALPYGLYSICVDNRSTNYGQSNATKATGYRYKTFTSGTAPTVAFHATPKRSGITLKGGVPTPDNSTQSISLDGTAPWATTAPGC
jgi:Tfp pilus assembly protein PilV